MGIVYREMLPAPPPGPPRRLLKDGEIPKRPDCPPFPKPDEFCEAEIIPQHSKRPTTRAEVTMGYQPRQTPEKALASAERQADALLFQADEGFARSLGIKLTPLELACHILGGPAPPGGLAP